MSYRPSYSAYDKSHRSVRRIRELLGESISEMTYYQTRLAEIDSKHNRIKKMLNANNLSEQDKQKLQDELKIVDQQYTKIRYKWNNTANRGGKTKKQRKHKKRKTNKKR